MKPARSAVQVLRAELNDWLADEANADPDKFVNLRAALGQPNARLARRWARGHGVPVVALGGRLLCRRADAFEHRDGVCDCAARAAEGQAAPEAAQPDLAQLFALATTLPEEAAEATQ